jgi:glycosyltransferase involved in cell wall biosynthesis
MNVLLMANELRYTCGVTNHLLHLAKGLTESGKVKLWIACGGGNGINRFSDIDVVIISDDVFLHLNRNFSNFLSAINSLNKIIRQNNIKIVHSHSHYAANIAEKAAKLTGTVTIQTNHGLIADRGKLKHFNADHYIVINEHIQEHLFNKEKIPAENINFIRCGIPIPEMEAKKSADKIKVIAASRFKHEKGLDIYINAVSMLNKDLREKSGFYIAGEGELEAELQSLNKQLGAGVNFMGSVKNMYGILEQSHILVYPSRSKSEGFPAIITEAGAHGNLVISSDFSGVRSVIEDGTDGLIFKCEEPEELAGELNKVLVDQEKYMKMAERFREKIKDRFRLETMINKHLELYNKCLAG